MMHRIFSSVLWILPKKIAHKLLFYRHMKKKLDLNNPKTLNEKIHWLIVNYYGKKEADLTDKYKVKKYIENMSIENLYVPYTYLILISKNDKVDFSKLPDKFVLKTNHGSGDIFICKDKINFNINSSLEKLFKLIKVKFAKNLCEYHYSYIEPLIMIEEFLDDKENDRPLDYKFFCYDGYVDSVMVCSDRGNNTKIDFFDSNWNHLNYSKKEKWSDFQIVKPKNLDEMFEIASKISKGFPFVRVDLYNINGKIYFGEMTFTPAAGLSTSYSEEGDLHLGSLLDIEKLKKEKKLIK